MEGEAEAQRVRALGQGRQPRTEPPGQEAGVGRVCLELQGVPWAGWGAAQIREVTEPKGVSSRTHPHRAMPCAAPVQARLGERG